MVVVLVVVVEIVVVTLKAPLDYCRRTTEPILNPGDRTLHKIGEMTSRRG